MITYDRQCLQNIHHHSHFVMVTIAKASTVSSTLYTDLESDGDRFQNYFFNYSVSLKLAYTHSELRYVMHFVQDSWIRIVLSVQTKNTIGNPLQSLDTYQWYPCVPSTVRVYWTDYRVYITYPTLAKRHHYTCDVVRYVDHCYRAVCEWTTSTTAVSMAAAVFVWTPLVAPRWCQCRCR